ncbi:MAG: efflux RND transporter permease subunit, partial [bacterium]
METSDKSKINELKHRSSEFFKFTTTRPVAILMVVIGISVFGWISYKQLPLNLMPEITYPSLTVRTEYPGTAPEEVETTISRPIEQALGIVDNLVSISSISKADQSDVKLEFTWDTDMNQATSDVREKLDHVYLAEEVKRPIILRYDPSLDPIMRLGLYGNASLFYLRYLAEEDLKRILETIEGVAAIKVKGGLEEEIRVELDEQKLTLIGINIQQVKNRLAQENVNLAGGNLKEGQTEYLVRTLNEFKTVEEIAEVVIGTWNGREIKIRDIAKVQRTNKDREIITRINGQESVEIEIYKEADANIVAVARKVTDRVFGTAEQQAFAQHLEEIKKQKEEQAPKDTTKEATSDKKQKQQKRGRGENLRAKMMTNFITHNLPEGIKIEKLSDQSIFIENSVNEVKSTAIMGGILAIIVLFIFLRNFTATMIVGVSIPISIIATFAPMKIFDVSLNIMSLGGLALGIGMLVDNSIVVLESIARCREEGDNLIQATIRGVGEVGGAVFAATLTTVAVFFPIVFVEGVAGQVFNNLALTVVFSLLASLAVALFLIPMLSSRETSKFVSGVQISGMLKQHIFHFSTEESINELITGNSTGSLLRKSIDGIIILLKTNGLIAWKVLMATFALLTVMLKFFLLLLILPLMPVFALLRIVRVIKFKLGVWVISTAEKPDLWKIRFIKEIWATFLVNNSIPAFFTDMSKIKNRFLKMSWKNKIFGAIAFPVFIIFYLLKFIFQFFLELVFRFFHYLIVVGGTLIKGFFIQIKLIFSIPVKLILTVFNWSYDRLEAVYPKLLLLSLNNRYVVIGGMVILFLFSVVVIAPRLGSELIPEVHQGEFNVDITLPVGTPVEKTDERVLDVQKFLNDQRGVDKVAAVIGTDKTTNTESEEGEHTAKLTVTMKRASSVIVAEERLIKNIRNEMKNYSGMTSKISRPVLFSFKTPIEVEIHGYNLQNLQMISKAVEEEMQHIPGLFDVNSNIQRGNPEVQIVYNRQLLSRYGLNILDVASIVRNKVRGDVATEFKDEDRKIDILVRLREQDKESMDDLRRLIVNPGGTRPLPLEAIADIRVKEGPAEIRRVDQQRTAIITANISGRDLGSVSEDIYQLLRNTDMPDNFTFN